jgi:hypothetical protein
VIWSLELLQRLRTSGQWLYTDGMNHEFRESVHWIAPTHTHTERSVDWYWGIGVLALAGMGLSVWFGNLLLALIIAVCALCLAMVASRYPRDSEISLTPEGISIDREMYPYDKIHSFWIHEDHPVHPKLYVATRSILHPHIAIIIEEPVEPAHVRAYLLERVPEAEGHSMATYVSEVLGF